MSDIVHDPYRTTRYGPAFPGFPVQVKKHRLLDCYNMYMTEAEMTATLNGSKTFTGIDFNAVVVTRAGDKNELIAYNTTGAGKALVDLETEIKNLRKNKADASTIASKVAQLEALEEAEDSATVYFKDNFILGIDRGIKVEKVEIESDDDDDDSGGDDGDKEYEIHYSLETYSPPFDESKINRLSGCTFTNCFFGQEQDDTILGRYEMDYTSGIGLIGGGSSDAPLEVFLKYMDLSGASFDGCTFSGETLFTGADLYGCKMCNSIFRKIDFDLTSNPRTDGKQLEDVLDENYDIVTPKDDIVPVNRADPYTQVHDHQKRPYTDWNDILYEDIDDMDYSYYSIFSYKDMHNSLFENCKLTGKQVAGLNLKNAWFYNCTFSDLHFHECEYDSTKFVGMTLSKVYLVNYNKYGSLILSGVNLSDCIISNATIEGYDFASNGISKVFFVDCILKNCKFNGANLVGSNIQDCSLTSCTFNNASMNEVQLCGSKFTDCDFTGITFSLFGFPSFVSSTLLRPVFSSNLNINNESLFNISIEDCTFTGWNFMYCIIDSAKLKTVRFNQCELPGAEMANSIFNDVAFTECVARGMKFNESSFTRTKFNDCDLSGSDFTDAAITKSEAFDDKSDLTGVIF